jgi:hypothetical protein
MTTRRRALQHYQRAIQALSNGQYGDLTDRERRALIRVLRDERQALLHEVGADATDPDPGMPRERGPTPPRTDSSE